MLAGKQLLESLLKFLRVGGWRLCVVTRERAQLPLRTVGLCGCLKELCCDLLPVTLPLCFHFREMGMVIQWNPVPAQGWATLLLPLHGP